jgi:Esterase/lipase
MIKTIIKRSIITISIILIIFLVIPATAFNLSPFAGSMLIRLFFDKLPKPPFEDPIYRDAVKVSYDISYGKSDDEIFDLYVPISTDIQNCPLIIWVHGGAFVGGDKRDVTYLAEALAYHGYAVASINYTRAPEASYPTPILQLDKAYTFLTTQNYAESDKIDTSRIFLAGDSAGAHTAAEFVIIQTNHTFKNQFLENHKITDFSDTSIPTGMLLYCGPYSAWRFEQISHKLMKFMVNQASWAYFGKKNPLETRFAEEIDIKSNVTANFPPSLIIDGNYMSFADHGRDLAARLSGFDVPVSKMFFDESTGNVPHEFQFDLTTEAAMISLEYTLEFLNQFE